MVRYREKFFSWVRTRTFLRIGEIKEIIIKELKNLKNLKIKK